MNEETAGCLIAVIVFFALFGLVVINLNKKYEENLSKFKEQCEMIPHAKFIAPSQCAVPADDRICQSGNGFYYDGKCWQSINLIEK